MKHKLVLIFAEDSEVNDIDTILLFNNTLDAETYLLSTGKIISINFILDEKCFTFKTNCWSGCGQAYWVVER